MARNPLPSLPTALGVIQATSFFQVKAVNAVPLFARTTMKKDGNILIMNQL
jgi:hypothetical protein